MSHTPAPWGYVYDGSSVWSVGREDDPQDARIAAVQKCSHGEDGWHEAAWNAQLIAAAPDLLNALKMLLGDIQDYQRINNLGGEDNHSQVTARAAIAKAEGR